jgi:hypothetical protein
VKYKYLSSFVSYAEFLENNTLTSAIFDYLSFLTDRIISDTLFNICNFPYSFPYSTSQRSIQEYYQRHNSSQKCECFYPIHTQIPIEDYMIQLLSIVFDPNINCLPINWESTNYYPYDILS